MPFEDPADAAKAESLLAQLESLNPDSDGETILSLSQQLDALFAPLDAAAQEVLTKLRDGASFEALIDEYGTTEALSTEPLRTEGVYISGRTVYNSPEYVEGVMLLERPGQVSEPLRAADGLHIAEYIRDIAPGEVPLAEIYDAVKAEALSLKQAEYYEQQLGMLLESAHVKFYPERLQ